MYRTLISCEDLEARLTNADWVVVDCRSKVNPAFHGETAYGKEHIAGAVYANLDRDLAAPHVLGTTGRHPLPELSDLVETLSRLGIDSSKQVVVYDDMGGGYASRMWWMLRWLGHEAVAVLDGGWQKWEGEVRPTSAGVETRERAVFEPRPNAQMLIDAAGLAELLDGDGSFVGDARSADRYRGENETLDPVPGHIPGAVSMPYSENITPEWTMTDNETLLRRFGVLGEFPPDKVAFYCGSGVTAAHNILAMVHAGLPQPRLYVGSWSEWITDPTRPTEVGP